LYFLAAVKEIKYIEDWEMDTLRSVYRDKIFGRYNIVSYLQKPPACLTDGRKPAGTHGADKEFLRGRS
jgi:hypothetical protein